jgi:hypothetical protein
MMLMAIVMSGMTFTVDHDNDKRKRETGECVPFNTAGYVDEEGKEVLVKIPEDRVEEIAKAVKAEDWEVLKGLEKW